MSTWVRGVVDPARLRELIHMYPSLRDLPIATRNGHVVTLGEAIKLLEQGDEWIAERLREKGFDPEGEELKRLAIEWYRRALSSNPSLRIYVLSYTGKPLGLSDIIYHIERGDELGRRLVELYEKMLRLAAELSR